MFPWLKDDKDYKQRAFTRQLESDRAVLEHLKNTEENFEAKIINQRLHEEQRQDEYYESLIKEERRKALLKAERSHEERVAKEMQYRQEEAFKEEKLRQLLRENSPELRELEAKLKTAFVTMVRFKQFADKDRIVGQELADKEKWRKIIDQRLKEYQEEEKQKELDQLMRKREYHEELNNHVKQTEEKRFESYLDFLREKMRIDAIVKKVIEDDFLAAQKKLEDQKKTQEYIDHFKRAKEKYRKEEEKRLAQENEHILEYLLAQDLRVKEVVELRKFRIEVKERVKEEILKILEERDSAKRNEDQVRVDLAVAEKDAAAKNAETARFEHNLRQKLELQKAEATQLRLKEERLEQEKREDQQFRQQMTIKLAEQDRLELMNEHKQRMKRIEHRKIIEVMIEENRMKRTKEKQYDMEVYMQEQQLEKLRQEIVETERMRMLEEKATKLLGFLPKGVLRDMNDVNKLGGQFREFYQRKPAYFDDDVAVETSLPNTEN